MSHPMKPPPSRPPGTGRPAPPPEPLVPTPAQEAHQSMVAVIGDDPDYFLAELEGVIVELHGARLALAKHKAQMAASESEFGSVGNLPSIWDHNRKILLGTQIEYRRMQLEAQRAHAIEMKEDPPPKITEAALDTWAHQSDLYVDFIKKAVTARTQYEKDRAVYDELWANVHLIEGKKSYLEARLRMIEEKMRYHRATANLSRG